jgi:hypothetical protein
MRPVTNSPRVWRERLNGAVWLALSLVALVGFVVVGQLPLWMIALTIFAGAVFGAVFFVFRWLVRRRDPAYSPRRSFIAFALAGALTTVGLASLPVYYLAFWVESGPTAVPLVTLSNGPKTVVFQGMQHIGSEDFYKSVVFDLEQALTEGFTLFYEGVTPVPERPDLTEWFNKTLRGTDKDLSAGYLQMSQQCGLTFQLDYFQTLTADATIHPSRHVTADVTYQQLKDEYDRLISDDPGFAEAMATRAAKLAGAAGKTVDPFASMVGFMATATPGQKRLAGIVCRGVLGMVVSGKLSDPEDPTNRLIIDFRNKSLARSVATATAEKIYITYGAAHFPGFFAELQKLDANFQIRAVKGVRPMTLADEVNLAPSAVSGVR